MHSANILVRRDISVMTVVGLELKGIGKNKRGILLA